MAAPRAREIRIFNDYKGIQTVGYAMSMPGEDTYVQTLGDGINDKDSAWQCDLTIYVANPSKCVWSSDIALITYQLNGATPNTAQQQVRVGNTVVLPPPESLGMWLPPGFEFDGWYMDGMEVQSVEVIGNVTLVGRVQYGEDAFTVSPVRLEVAYDNTSRHPIAVSCPNNTWTVSAADPSWATVIKISQAQAGITLSQNNSTEDRSQAITFTWTAPDGTTIIRTVDVTQAIYLEVIGEITATIRVVGVDTGSGVQGMTVQLLIDGEIVASGITNAQGIWNSSWTEEQRHWEAVQNIEFAVSENAQYNGTMVALSQKPLFNDAVTNGINYGSATVSRKTQYVQLAYSLPQATPSVVQRQVVSGQQTTLESIASLGMVLPNYMDFDSWRVNGVVQTTITPTANTSVIGIATYNDNALIVTPTLIEHGDNDPTARTVSVTCVDNLWSITAGDPSWVTATKINQNTASIVFAQNTSTTERSQDITVSWTSSYGDRLTRNIVAIQLPRIEVLENIPLGVELVSSEDGTSFAGVDVDFFATLNGTESKIASGITDGNGEWSGTWRISAESYANVSLVKMTAGANTYIIFPYSLRWNAGFNLPTFNGAKGGAYNTGVIEADAYGDSYIIYTDEAGGGRLRFYSHDAPLANFSTTSSSGTSTIVVRGITITKSNVKEIFFGSSYDGTTALPNNFLRGFTSLISSPLKSSWRPTALPDYLMASCSSITQIIFPSEWAIIAIGSYVFSSCSKAEQIILPQEWTVGNIGSHFLYACSSLGSLIFPDTWPITVLGGFFLALDVNLMNLYMGNRQSWANVSVGTNAFFNMNQSTRTHHHETYEQAMAFKAKFSNTSTWAHKNEKHNRADEKKQPDSIFKRYNSVVKIYQCKFTA